MTGGFGSARSSRRSRRPGSPTRRTARVAVRIIGIPGDRFVDHGSVDDLRRLIRLDVPGLTAQVREAIAQLGIGGAVGQS